MDWSNKKVLITGIGGFIGSNLAKNLLEKSVKIIGVDNFSYVNKNYSQNILRKITLVEDDISRKEVFQKIPNDFDYIFHLGAPSSIILFNKNPQRCYRETIFGQLNILEFVRMNDVKKVIYFTSGSVYAGNQEPYSERIYPQPRNSYAAAKMACEALASSYKDFVDSVGLRIFAGYGPGEERKGKFASVIYLFTRDIMSNKSPLVYGDGTQSRDFVHINDIVGSIIKAAESKFAGIVNVGTGVSTPFNKLIEIINSALGKNIKPTYTDKSKNYVEKLRADVHLMKKVLNVSGTEINTGIKSFCEYLSENSKM